MYGHACTYMYIHVPTHILTHRYMYTMYTLKRNLGSENSPQEPSDTVSSRLRSSPPKLPIRQQTAG